MTMWFYYACVLVRVLHRNRTNRRYTHTPWFGQKFCLLFFGKWLWKKPNELFAQPSTYTYTYAYAENQTERDLF